MGEENDKIDFSKMSPSQKENVFDNVKLQIAAANAEIILQVKIFSQNFFNLKLKIFSKHMFPF